MAGAKKGEGRKKTKGTRERDYQLEHGRAGLFATYIGKLVGSKFKVQSKFRPGIVVIFSTNQSFFAKINILECLKVI